MAKEWQNKNQLLNSENLVNAYITSSDWRTKENSNSPMSFGALNKYITGEVTKNYWLNSVYTDDIKTSYLNGDLHIHDLGALTIYCCGYSLENILMLGVQGISNIPVSSPAKHFQSALSQVVNLATIYQNEIAGAVAFNSLDTLLAPFIRYDNLTEKEVKQHLQDFIYAINSNSRMGSEPAFTNVTLDVVPTSEMAKKNIIIGGEYKDEKYGDFQKEMDLFNDVFCSIMLQGDFVGKPFAYPIVTYNIGKNFDWDSPRTDKMFEMAGKFGYPYFANYINSELDEGDLRSMCCRLRLDLTELKKRNGGLFGSGDSTGSIGVVTINLPRIAYKTDNLNDFYKELDRLLNIAKDSLEIKRKFLQEIILDNNMLPAFSTYVGTIDNHFSTIGIIGMNEMCMNFYGVGIKTDLGKEFATDVNKFILNKLVDFQVETGHLYNYEATPAESTCYRLAKSDKAEFPDIKTQGTDDAPYYTNSCHIPVAEIVNIMDTYEHQDELQSQFTGGTVIHNYLQGSISGEKAKHIIKTILTKYKAPYTSLSPINRYCKEHGYIDAITEKCPHCDTQLELYQRITGYLRPVSKFNIGKTQEYKDRKQLKGDNDLTYEN